MSNWKPKSVTDIFVQTCPYMRLKIYYLQDV